MRRAGLIALALLALAGGAQAQNLPDSVDSAGLAADFRTNEAALKPFFDERNTPAYPRNPAALLRHRWILIREAVREATAGGHLTALVIAAAIRKLDPDADVGFARLGPTAILVAVNHDGYGNVFIATSKGIGWSIEETAAQHPSIRDPLGAWAPEHEVGGCRDINRYDNFGCDAQYARVGRLMDGPHGQRRFFINGIYFQEAGATEGAQLSIWSWDGVAPPRPMHVTTYLFMADQDFTARGEGNAVRIRSKDDFKGFFACGSCFGRQMERVLRLTANGVEDSGAISLNPDLDRVDELIDAILHNRSVGSLATSSVVAHLRKAYAETLAEAKKPDAYISLGMLGGWTETSRGPRRELCLTTDDGRTQIFTLAGSGKKTRVVGVRDSATDCGKNARN